MGNSRHVFIQVDTNTLAIEALAMPGKFQKASTEELCKLVRAHSMIYNQGSMSMGSPVNYFTIGVDPAGDQDIYLTILPVQLFSNHKVYFTEFVCTDENGIGIPANKNLDAHAVSFSINTGNVASNGSATFMLKGILEFDDFHGNKMEIPLCIDPRLQASQPGGG